MTSKHPALMLRRTESIVEKMLTNWLALCMYDYMKDYAGSSLFVLFKAIKFQVIFLVIIKFLFGKTFHNTIKLEGSAFNINFPFTTELHVWNVEVFLAGREWLLEKI